ncbi:MAG: hypothetical protein R3335_02310 [Anaerolineales bacterium]|nr:hypothetical protein [Anaerolineales bacterium]
MDFALEIRSAESNPEELERLYQAARKKGLSGDFKQALLQAYEAAPENLLFAAWFFRFREIGEAAKPRRSVNWPAAIPLSILTGLIFWALSDFDNLTLLDGVPQLLLWWSPIAAMSALVFMALTARDNYRRAAALGLGLLAITAYAVFIVPAFARPRIMDQLVVLAMIHIPLLCWAALGVSVLGFKSSPADRFAFLKKSVEVIIVAGLYLIAGVAFGGITMGMFAALSIDLPDIWLRLIAAGGIGLLPVLAVATVYDPSLPPSEQDFEQGLSQFIATMMRLLLPLTLAVMVIYIFVIPFFFFEPYENRDVLIVYNLMLFAIVGLLLGATPLRGDDLSSALQKWLRYGIITVAVLAVLISIYALSATAFRTFEGGLTPNRMTIVGWNIINIGILILLIYRQFRDGGEGWISSLQSVFSRGASAYLVWGLFLLLALPVVFLLTP